MVLAPAVAVAGGLLVALTRPGLGLAAYGGGAFLLHGGCAVFGVGTITAVQTMTPGPCWAGRPRASGW